MKDIPYKERPAVVFDPVGFCIYCGEKAKSLSNEHIIPYALAGNMILPKSSCSTCAKITAEIERICLNVAHKPIRTQLNLPSRRPILKTLPFTVHDSLGNALTRDVPSEDFPKMCFGFRSLEPGLLSSRTVSAENNIELVAKFSDEEIRPHLKDGEKFKLGSFSHTHYARMLAKIAHSFMIGKYGYN